MGRLESMTAICACSKIARDRVAKLAKEMELLPHALKNIIIPQDLLSISTAEVDTKNSVKYLLMKSPTHLSVGHQTNLWNLGYHFVQVD